jgi:hypothetical protein
MPVPLNKKTEGHDFSFKFFLEFLLLQNVYIRTNSVKNCTQLFYSLDFRSGLNNCAALWQPRNSDRTYNCAAFYSLDIRTGLTTAQLSDSLEIRRPLLGGQRWICPLAPPQIQLPIQDTEILLLTVLWPWDSFEVNSSKIVFTE